LIQLSKYPDIRQKVDSTYNVNESLDNKEIHNYKKLDKILSRLCQLVVKGQDSDKDYGMVAAGVLDPDNNLVCRLNIPDNNGKRIHAERAAIEAYESKYGTVPEGSIVITTLSSVVSIMMKPCMKDQVKIVQNI